MKIDSSYRIDVIAAEAERDILQHILITQWHEEPVAVAADGFLMAVVPIELDHDDVPGLVHSSIFTRERQLRIPDEDSIGGWSVDLQMQLRADHVVLPDGWTAPREGNAGGVAFPSWQAVIPARITADNAEPVFGIQPALLLKAADALGTRMVTVHRSSQPTQVVIAPLPLGDDLEPPFAVMMLAKIERRSQVAVMNTQV